jgi:hypothetical protein
MREPRTLPNVAVELVEAGDYRQGLVGQRRLVCRQQGGIKAGAVIGVYR